MLFYGLEGYFGLLEKPEKTRVFPGENSKKPETRVLKIRPELETLVSTFNNTIIEIKFRPFVQENYFFGQDLGSLEDKNF